MDNENQTNNQEPQGQENLDPWAQAFEALERQTENDSEGATNGGGASPDAGGQSGPTDGMGAATSTQPIPAQESAQGTAQSPNVSDNSGTSQAGTGGPDTTVGGTADSSGQLHSEVSEITEEYLESYQESLLDDIRDRAIAEINDRWLKSGKYLTYNGVVGANINDERICKRDRDGVPHFYNGETGREFVGDNPRQQAQQYVQAYNAQLAPQYNAECNQLAQQMLQEEMPMLEVLRFANTYERMDPIRKQLFDQVIAPAEIKDTNGEVIGYSVNLDQALDLVNNQVSAIQQYYQQSKQDQAGQPTPVNQGPVLDIKSSVSSTPKDPREVKSVADALLVYQDQLLQKGTK